MFQLRELFHLTHVVEDVEATVSWYEDVFAGQCVQRSAGPGVDLALVVVADLLVDAMTPAPGADLAAPAKFMARFGEHLHSLALWVEEPEDLIAHLRSCGLRLAGHDGLELERPLDEIWTRPRETPCLLEFFAVRSGTDLRHEEERSSTFWRDEHPLGIVRTACYTVVVPELRAGTAFFVDVTRGTVVHHADTTPYGTRSAFVALGDAGVVVEVAEPLDGTSRAARDLARCGSILHATTIEVTDLERAVGHLTSKGLAVERPVPGHAVLDPAGAHGVLYRFTDRPLSTW